MTIIQNMYFLKKILKHSKKANNLIEKWAKDLSTHLAQEDTQMVKKYMKRVPTGTCKRKRQRETSPR